jgi:opacity protein-like surface antigen
MKKLIAVTIAATAFATPAFAEGVYAGLQAGSATYKFADTPNSVSAVGGLVGYQINPNFAAEVAYNSYGSANSNVVTWTSVKASAVSLSGVLSAPLNDSFSVYCRLGVANVTADGAAFGVNVVSTSNMGLATGLGAQFNFNSQFGARVGYDVNKVAVRNATANLTSLNGALIVKF